VGLLTFEAKSAIQTCAKRLGDRIERLRDDSHAIDVFGLLVLRLLSCKAEPFVIQIGANDGIFAIVFRPRSVE
jgi:hypothetical protein